MLERLLTYLRSMSLTLTGNKSHPATDANGKPSQHHVHIYRATDIESHPEIQLTRGGLILIALMSKSDYDEVSLFPQTRSSCR